MTLLFSTAKAFNDIAHEAKKQNLTAPETCACICNDEGGPLTLEQAMESRSSLYLSASIVHWREGSRPLTPKGRQELSNEATVATLLRTCLENSGLALHSTGDGDFENGQGKCYDYRLNSHDSTLTACRTLDSLINCLCSLNFMTSDGDRDELDSSLWDQLNTIRELITAAELRRLASIPQS